IALLLLRRLRVPDRSATLFRSSLVPVLTVLLTIAFGNREWLPYSLATLRRGYVKDVEARLPDMDRELPAALERAGVAPADPIEAADYNLPPARRAGAQGGRRRVEQRAWLPTHPYVLFSVLPEHRRRAYFARFVERTRGEGWIIQPRRLVATNKTWAF